MSHLQRIFLNLFAVYNEKVFIAKVKGNESDTQLPIKDFSLNVPIL